MSEKTEAKLVLNYEFLINKAEDFGADYTPPNQIAQVSKMQTKLTNIKTKRTQYKVVEAELETMTNSREDLMKETLPIFGETITYCKSLQFDKNDLDALTAINRVIQGRRATPVPAGDAAGGNGGETPNTHSVARTSYASRADKAAEFVELLRSNPKYVTTDDKFALTTFDARVTALQDANSNVTEKESERQNLRNELDFEIYLDADSLVESGKSSKNYIKSRFTTSHPVWNQIKNIRFDKPSRLMK